MRTFLLMCATGLVALPLASCGERPQARVPEPPARTAGAPAAPVVSTPATTGATTGAATGAATAPAAPSTGTTSGSDPASWVVSAASDDPAVAQCGGLRFTKPVTWPWITPTMRFRTLQYMVPGEDTEPAADLIFSVFPPGGAGPIGPNIERWARQFKGAEGQEPRKEQRTLEVNDMTIHFIELEGSYAGMGAAAPRAGWSQLGMIIKSPVSDVFVRLLGPSDTVLRHADDFEDMMMSVQLDD